MLISLENVTFGYTDAPILEGVTFSVHENERIGLVGGNGEGQTTLINLMLGTLTPDAGSVTVKNGVQIGYLEQSGGAVEGETVYSAMEEIFTRDRELIAALRETETRMAQADEATMKTLSAKYESLNKQITARDSYHY
ncbi:MAG: ATP-binding cassette domain-containing protein, partial [Clostridiales bacterium]|nr:ATP-binding cassette domain-containing protein [Clostridiales bacterium]